MQIMILMRKRALFLLLLAAILPAIWWSVRTVSAPTFMSDVAIAREEVEACQDKTGEAQKELCYEKNIPRLMDQGLSMERVFSVIRIIQETDTGYQSCHVLAHIITEKEVAKDTSKWKDVVVRSPVGICGSGAMHGAFQERFREESFPDATVAEMQSMLTGVCNPRDGWEPTYLDRSSCMHGMGHLFLYVTDANVKKSIALCEVVARLPDKDFRQTCLDGVFMQLYQPLEPEDEVLIRAIASATKNSQVFCSQFTGLAYNVCVKESWPSVEGSWNTPGIFEDLCERTTDRSAQITCASGLMFAVIEMAHYDVPRVEDFCRGIVDLDVRSLCWARIAAKFVWADWRNIPKAVGICRDDTPEESKSVCWEELITYAQQGIPSDSRQARELCSAIPEPWRNVCAQKTNTVL